MTDLLVLAAADFAADKHRNQRRKDDAKTPYINHPIRVALTLSEIGGVDDAEVLAAALLHDTLEDTKTVPAELETKFGPAVREMVEEVTDDKTLPKLERKRLQIEHAPHVSTGAALVKIADKISNVVDMTNSPPKGWGPTQRQEYIDWAETVVSQLPRGNEALEKRFAEVLLKAREELRRS